MSNLLATGLAAAVLFGVAARAEEKGSDRQATTRREASALDGTWEVVSVVANGTKSPATGEKRLLTIRGGEYRIREGGRTVAEGKVKLQPDTRPKAIDFMPVKAGNKVHTQRAIYEVKGDQARICFAPPGNPRPEAFETVTEARRENENALINYKRVEPGR